MGRHHGRTVAHRAVFVLFAVLFFSGCIDQVLKPDRPKGVYHRIKKGETLWSIARAYHVQVQDLAEINNIDDPALIEVNRVLFIPDAKQVIDDVMSSIITQKTSQPPGKAVRPSGSKKPEGIAEGPKAAKKEEAAVVHGGRDGADAVSAADKSLPTEKGERAGIKGKEGESLAESGYEGEEAASLSGVKEKEGGKDAAETAGKQVSPAAKASDELQFDRKRFIWPVKGNVVSHFGIQPNGMFYNGIKINAKEGQSVVASDGGTVIFSSSIKDYGETVIIKHADNYATVYTNLGSRLVKTDDKVKKGEQIAFLTRAEKPGAAFINFEIRHRNKARNPLFFLP